MIVEKLRGGGLLYDEVRGSSLLWFLSKLQPLTLWRFFSFLFCEGCIENEEQARCWDHHKKEKE